MFGLAAKYEWLNACTGIELLNLADQSYNCRYCSVSVDKGQLNIDAKGELSGSLPEILKKLPAASPIALTLTGKGILTKRVPKLESLTSDSLNQVFPNLKAEHFYVQNFISGDYSFISLIRREVVDTLLEDLAKADIKALMISLGVFPVSAVLSQFNTYGDEIVFEGHRIQYTKEYNWVDYGFVSGKASEFPLKIDSEIIPEKQVIAYATAFQLVLFGRIKVIQLPVDVTHQTLAEYKEELRFKFRLSIVLGSFFVLLLINFLLFSYYSSTNEVLITEVNQNSAGVENIQKLSQEVNSKEQLLKELGWYKGMSYAWMCDQIAQSVPATILLNELNINPLNKQQSNRGRKEVYDRGRIIVHATTVDLSAVNDWIYFLKEKDWVKQVILNHYAPSEDDESQEFNITIKY